MSLLLAVLVVLAFAYIVSRLRLAAHTGEVVRRARGSYAAVSDRSLTDEQKERRLKEEAPRLFALLGRIVAGSVLALGLPLGVLWVGDRLGLVSLPDVLGVLMRLDFIVVLTAVGVLVGWWMSRRGR